jgi:hypothetical protein
MANALYPKFKEAILQAQIDLSAVNVKAVLVDTGAYTYSSSHQYLSDIAGGARISTSGNMASKTFTNGAFDCADFSFTAVSGATCEAIVWYVDTGVAGTSRLIVYIDTATGLTLTPNGADVNVTLGTSLFAL